MKITRDNYEIWFLDYLVGRLDKEGMEAVQNFLIHHPNLAEELDTEIITLHTDHNSRFAGKESLKKEPLDDPAVFETAAIASMEGDLTE